MKPQSAHLEQRRLRRELAEARERFAALTRQLRLAAEREEALRQDLAAAKAEMVSRSYRPDACRDCPCEYAG